MASECPNETCDCETWPPEDCPYCGMRSVGYTATDWWWHFEQDCKTTGKLYCFVAEPPSESVKA